jgi:hypothetical protein
MGSLESELRKLKEALFPKMHEPPSRPPNAADISIESLYGLYTDKLENASIKDPLGRAIHYKAENFPYLIKMEFWNKKAKRWVDANATAVIEQLKSKTFDSTRYRVGDDSRARTLFWISGIISSPDCIHENNNEGMTDKEVYVMRYKRKSDNAAEIKVVLIAELRKGRLSQVRFGLMKNG